MATRGQTGADGVEPGSDERAASLLSRWQAHHDEASADAGAVADPVVTPPAEPSVSLLDEVRTRRGSAEDVEGPPEVVVRRPKHAAVRRPPDPTDRATDSVLASREILDALGRSTTPSPEAAPETSTSTSARTSARTSSRTSARTSATTTAGPEVGPSRNVDFAPRLGARRVIGLLLLVFLVAAAGAAYLAFDDPRPLTLGGAAILLLVTLLLYAVRAGSAPTYVAIRSGQLEVSRGKTVERFDLTSRFMRIEVVGTPGRPGWKVQLGRFGRDPLVISAAIVDPKKFTAELERYRPRS